MISNYFLLVVGLSSLLVTQSPEPHELTAVIVDAVMADAGALHLPGRKADLNVPLVNVGSFVEGVRRVWGSEVARAAIERGLPRPFTDVPDMWSALDCVGREEGRVGRCRVRGNRVFVQLDSLEREGDSYRAVVTQVTTEIRGPSRYATCTRFLELRVGPVDGTLEVLHKKWLRTC